MTVGKEKKGIWVTQEIIVNLVLRGESHQFAILSIHKESVPKGHRKQERINTILELKSAFRVSLLYKWFY